MPVQPTNDVFTPAFQLLASTVNDFCLRARPCLGATLKPKLHSHGLDEKSIGFRKFGDFLRAAEAAGYVKLGKTSGGDIAIFPTSATPAPAQVVPPPVLAPFAPDTTIIPASLVSSNVPLRVRQDLWNAFNSFSDKWVYDPERDLAMKEDIGSWSAPQRTLIAIPTGRDRVTEWMRAFANTQDPNTKAILLAALDNGAEMYKFNNLTHSMGLQRAWRRFHILQVLTAIQTWAAAQLLHPRSVVTPFQTPTADLTTPATIPLPVALPPAASPSAASSQLNTRLESLIDTIITELISLRGLLAVVGPK